MPHDNKSKDNESLQQNAERRKERGGSAKYSSANAACQVKARPAVQP